MGVYPLPLQNRTAAIWLAKPSAFGGRAVAASAGIKRGGGRGTRRPAMNPLEGAGGDQCSLLPGAGLRRLHEGRFIGREQRRLRRVRPEGLLRINRLL